MKKWLAAYQFGFLSLPVLSLAAFSSCSLLPFRNDPPEITYEHQLRDAVQSKDLIVGMYPREVRAAWGEPDQVEYPNQGSQGTERWIYYRSLAAFRSLNPARVVYFEGNQVAGWDTVR